MSYKYINPNSWVDPALARAALAECEELLRQSQDRIARAHAETDAAMKRIEALESALRDAHSTLRAVWVKTGEGLDGLERVEQALGLMQRSTLETGAKHE